MISLVFGFVFLGKFFICFHTGSIPFSFKNSKTLNIMAAKSKHWKDVNDWLVKVIESCTTIRQLLHVQNLITLYKKKYPKREREYVMLFNRLNSKYYCLVEQQIDI